MQGAAARTRRASVHLVNGVARGAQLLKVFFRAHVSHGLQSHVGLIVNAGQMEPVLLKLQEEHSLCARTVVCEFSELGSPAFALERYSSHFHGTSLPRHHKTKEFALKKFPLQVDQGRTLTAQLAPSQIHLISRKARNIAQLHFGTCGSRLAPNREENAVKRALIVAVATATLATPAFADFYIVREGNAGQCRVVETKPTDSKIVVIGNKVYKTRADAEKELTVVCKAK
jgi:hypothetical protein